MPTHLLFRSENVLLQKQGNHRLRSNRTRQGKLMVVLAILLPAILGFTGLILDTGVLFSEFRNLKHATDAAATAAAVEIRLQTDSGTILAVAEHSIQDGNQYSDADVVVRSPPMEGPFAGENRYVEVIATRRYHTLLINAFKGEREQEVVARSVAGVASNTPGAAVVILDPDPSTISIPSTQHLLQNVSNAGLVAMAVDEIHIGGLLTKLPLIGNLVAAIINSELTAAVDSEMVNLVDAVNQHALPAVLPALPTLIAGLEIEGVGRLSVDGAIHVNNQWGGENERGLPVGTAGGPPYAIGCMPILPTTRVTAKHIRVVGGVDRAENYGAHALGDQQPLKAGRIAVPDPLADVVPPASSISIGGPPSHEVHTVLSAASAVGVVTRLIQKLPEPARSLLVKDAEDTKQKLQSKVVYPGVYESLTVIAPAGGAKLMPGVYVIRGRNPVTQLSLCLVGPIQADGVLLYIGDPSASSDSSVPPPRSLEPLIPSTLVAPLLPGGRISGLDLPGDPLDGMLIFQDRNDRRPVILEAQNLVGSTELSGIVYAKWGHVSFVGGHGRYDLSIVSGTCRVLTLGDTRISPSRLLRAAEDVVLVE